MATVAWISVSPVKGLALRQLDECELTEDGVAGDRAFFLVDDDGRLVNSKGLGALQQIVPRFDDEAGTLELRFPDGTTVSEQVAVDGSLDAQFWGVAVPVRTVVGGRGARRSPISRDGACGSSGRQGRRPTGLRSGAATLLGTASLRAIARVTSVDEVDGRRFRMNFGIDGLREHEEDEWLGRRVRLGEAIVVPQGNVGRCAVTTQNPDTGKPDLDTLKALAAYRREPGDDRAAAVRRPRGGRGSRRGARRRSGRAALSRERPWRSASPSGGLLPDWPVSGLRAAGRRVGRRDHLLRRLDPVHRRRRAAELAGLG